MNYKWPTPLREFFEGFSGGFCDFYSRGRQLTFPLKHGIALLSMPLAVTQTFSDRGAGYFT